MTLAAVRRILELEAKVRDLEQQWAELRAQLRRFHTEAGEAGESSEE